MRLAASATVALACLAGALGGCAPEDADAAPVDICKPHDGAAPTVVVGQGREAYAELVEHEIVQLEAGAQGGHHVWLAVWMTGLERSGSVLSVRGIFPELGVEIPPFTAGVTFHEAEDQSGCELVGIRFQVDRGMGLEDVLGQTLVVEITVEDTTGDVGTGTQTMTLASAIAGGASASDPPERAGLPERACRPERACLPERACRPERAYRPERARARTRRPGTRKGFGVRAPE